jgi:2-keto-4-pentenoate hydratase/2-oxohepta-3-ene-1,7-dioic acid hydratase in catechol pathway
MRLISYRSNSHTGVGVMTTDTDFIELPKVAPNLPTKLVDILSMPNGMEEVAKAIEGASATANFSDVELDPVIPEPHAIWALALNFKTHIAETGLTTSPDFPHVFLRIAAAHVGHLQPLMAPPVEIDRAFDYEGELVVIIGRGGRHIPREKAMQHVAGFSIYNEGSVRGFQKHNRQFGVGKNFEASGSFGPWLMTPDEFGNPYDKVLRTEINGVIRQEAQLDDLIFNCEDLIHYLSTGYSLRTGDIIVMGTPGALPPKPGDTEGSIENQYGPIKYAGMVHMKPGDKVSVSIDGLGELVNPIEADGPVEYRPD